MIRVKVDQSLAFNKFQASLKKKSLLGPQPKRNHMSSTQVILSKPQQTRAQTYFQAQIKSLPTQTALMTQTKIKNSHLTQAQTPITIAF